MVPFARDSLASKALVSPTTIHNRADRHAERNAEREAHRGMVRPRADRDTYCSAECNK